tara:strand:- start:542 stop:943 length:402 start_codon:yes stop_codon:yes gene_type:complete
MLSGNPNAIHLLEQNQDKIDWRMLSSNQNAINLLEKNQDKIVWTLLCQNPLGYELLKTAVLKNFLPQYVIYNNPNIFTIDYQALKKRTEIFEEELMQKYYHPSRLFNHLEKYNYDIGDDTYYENGDYIIEISV